MISFQNIHITNGIKFQIYLLAYLVQLNLAPAEITDPSLCPCYLPHSIPVKLTFSVFHAPTSCCLMVFIPLPGVLFFQYQQGYLCGIFPVSPQEVSLNILVKVPSSCCHFLTLQF